MNIAVDGNPLNNDGKKGKEYPLFESIFFLASKKKDHRFIIITDNKLPVHSSYPDNVEINPKGSPAKKNLLHRYLPGIKIARVINKIKADVLISFERTYNVSVPQLLITDEAMKWKKKTLNKAALLIVNSEWQKNEIIKMFGISSEKITTVSPVVDESYRKIGETEKELIKANNTNGNEFFICTANNLDENNFYNLLKSYSHFKKRLQSNMKLVLLTRPGLKMMNRLTTYKYRQDIVFIENADSAGEAALIGSAYGVIIDAGDSRPVNNTLKALKCGVPVICAGHEVINEIAGNVVLLAEAGSEKGIGEKMIRLYTDEGLRNKLINNGTVVADGFTQRRAMESLWNCINKVVK